MSKWIDLNDVQYFTQKSGKQRPKYRVICSHCNTDRGYKMLQNAKNHPNCNSCARKLDAPRAKIHWQKFRQENEVWNKDKVGLYSEETLIKIGNASANRNYSEEQKLEIKLKKKLTFAIRYGFSSIEEHDIAIKIKRNLRSRMNKAVSGSYKSGSAVSDLGCSIEEFRTYIEAKFESWMNWDNYGNFSHINKTWQFDHIVPLISFNLKDEVEYKKACHYTNLQPLLSKDNLEKRKTDGTFNCSK